MATPIYATVLSQINTYIVANGNNEITANVLNPILKLMLDFANNNIGNLDTLTTDEKNSIVEAINSLKENFNDLVNNGVQLYTGIDNPNDTPPPTYKYADFYMQVDIDSLPVKLWQWNGFEWTDESGDPATESDNVLNNSDVYGVTVTDALNNLLTERIIDAKQFGAKADGTTNDTDILQAYLDSGQGIYIFPKGNYSISGIDVNAYSTLYFEEGAVLVLRNNSDRSVLQNKNFSANTDKNIEIYGIEIEGNEANQIKNSVTVPYVGEPTVGLRFFGVENLKIVGAKINKARTYGIWLSRIKNGVFNDIEFNQSLLTIDNQDGIHFNGLCYNLEISNIRGVTNDDMIALNANDVPQGVNVSFGEIKNAVIRDVIFNNNLNGIRLLSAGNLLDQVYISNLSGNVRDNVIAISSYTLGTANFGSIVIDGVNVRTNTPYNVLGEYGGYILVNDKIEYLKVSNVYRETGADARPTVRIQSRADISKLILDNISDKINPALTTYYPEISFESGSIVSQAFISNLRLFNGTFPNGYCIGATGSTITRLHLENIYAEQIGYGLYLNNTDISTLFVNVLNTNYIRYPFYLVNDSDIGLAQIRDNGWLYSAGTPNVYNVLDTSSISIIDAPVANALTKYDDNFNIVKSTVTEINGELRNTLATNGYAAFFEKSGGFGAAIALKDSSGSSDLLIRMFDSADAIKSELALTPTGVSFSTGTLGVVDLGGAGTRQVVADADGNLSATDIAPTSGTYTPTLTGISNVSVIALTNASYSKIGNIVTVMVGFELTATATAPTIGSFSITKPINRTGTGNLSIGCGSVFRGTGGSSAPVVVSSASTSLVTVSFAVPSTNVMGGNVVFQYDITQ